MDPVSISLRKRAGGVVGQKFQSQDSSVESPRTNTEADWSMGFFVSVPPCLL